MSTAAAVPRQSAIRTSLAGLIGNLLEWFDFGVFGFFSVEIGAQFFSGNDPAAQQLKAFAVFAIGFGARPIGSIVLGRVGDVIGRRALLTLSIALMGGATLALGLLPTYDQVGLLAPILLVLVRIIQGFSLGGEFTGSMVYTTELASPKWRGLISSSTAAGTTLGFILGSGSALLVRQVLGADATTAWGWRIPFIASFVLVLGGWLLRRGIHESEEGEKAAELRAPLWSSLISDWRPILQTFGIVALTNAAYYLTFTFAVEYRKSHPGGLDATFFQAINTVVLFVVLFAKPLGGWLSDLVGRRRLMIALTAATMALLYFSFGLMVSGDGGRFALGQVLMAVPLGMALGLQGAMLVEIFPLKTRVTSMSVGYSITLALSGGVAPLIATWMLKTYNDPQMPVYFTLGYGVVAFIVLFTMRETNARRLDT